MIIHPMMYTMTIGNMAVINITSSVPSRMTVESTSIYSANPPHTPAIFLSVRDLYSLFMPLDNTDAPTEGFAQS